MKINLLIIGKKSFIGSNIYDYYKHKYKVKIIGFKEFLKKKEKYLKRFNYVINCTTSQRYILKKYNSINDFDLIIAKKISHLRIHMIFISTRKVYKPKFDIKEISLLKPNCGYSRNKLTTEKKLIKILKKKATILRVSNLIGLPLKKSRKKLHYTFIDHFFDNIKNGVIYNNGKIYKDFISISKFCQIIGLVMSNKLFGIYNVSIGKKVYLNTLIKWLNYYNPNSFKHKKIKKNFNKDSFTLNNEKLMKRIKLKNRIIDLKNYSKKISKIYFKNN